ncbi:MAG: P27 family phage terminase small subunit [Deltaproteobacteria bacterium]|nr:P27 family phage terminase small subunit [Deltaproteobacteria bacterium]
MECAVNAELRENHLAQLETDAAKALYDRTLSQCQARPGGLRPADQDMIFDLCKAEDIKSALQQDLRERGVMVTVRNGRQVFKKENPSVTRLRSFVELQRKLRGDLRLIPPKSAQEEEEAPEDDFESF